MSTAAPPLLSLDQLRRGDRATVRHIDDADGGCDHLRPLGLYESCNLTVCRHGRMCIVEVESGHTTVRLALDRCLSTRVRVALDT